MAIDLRDYVEVKERIRAFYERFPTGSIRTELVRLQDDLVVFKAMVYRDPHDPVPTTGWAYDRFGAETRTSSHVVESCETSAIGRALANRGFAVGRRPSREEMAKVQRLRRDARSAATRTAGTGAPTPEPSEARIRRLMAQIRLSASKRARIEARLEQGMTDQQLHDLEAYLIALRSRAS